MKADGGGRKAEGKNCKNGLPEDPNRGKGMDMGEKAKNAERNSKIPTSNPGY